jgi:DNA-binding response OmpR family regulator
MQNPQLILICDDQPIIHETLGVYLENEGFTFISAFGGEEALEKFRSADPALIILDIMMPGISGIDVCREIRKESRVPVIMLTARGEEIDRVLGLNCVFPASR